MRHRRISAIRLTMSMKQAYIRYLSCAVIADVDTVCGKESARLTNNGDEMTRAPSKVEGRYVRAHEFLRRDEYDTRLVKEREALNAVSPILTRKQWLTAMDPFAMLALLRDFVPDEELRAFCCACCRRMWLTHDATETVMLDTLQIAEAFATGQASRAELHAAHRNIAPHAEEAGDRFARVNMKLGDSTDKWDYISAAYDYELAEALADITDDDIGYVASRCISHALEIVRIKPGFASKEYGWAARASEEKAQADMIRERWPYPAESADRLLETRRYREFRLALAARQYLAHEQWKIVKLFAARLEGMDRERLKNLCHEQISALSVMLPPATVRHILLDDLTLILGVPTLYAGAWRPRWRGLSRPQLVALPNNRIAELMADHLQAAPPGAFERWCCSLFFDQLTAVALGRIGRPSAEPVWPIAAYDLSTSFLEHVSTLRALPPQRSLWRFWPFLGTIFSPGST
jgi:hypothetical protein